MWDGSFGLVVWNAAVVITRMLEVPQHRALLLGDALAAPPGDGRALTALDVGAGSGLAGLALGVLGAEVTLTDYEPRVVEQLAANMALNREVRRAVTQPLPDRSRPLIQQWWPLRPGAGGGGGRAQGGGPRGGARLDATTGVLRGGDGRRRRAG